MENRRTEKEIKIDIAQVLENNDELYDAVVDELDSWNGYADGFRCYPMCELDDIHSGMKLSEFLERITEDFNFNDEYFYYSIYGLESTDDKHSLYTDNIYTDELIEELVADIYDINIDWVNGSEDLLELIEELEEAEEAEETAAA